MKLSQTLNAKVQALLAVIEAAPLDILNCTTSDSGVWTVELQTSDGKVRITLRQKP